MSSFRHHHAARREIVTTAWGAQVDAPVTSTSTPISSPPPSTENTPAGVLRRAGRLAILLVTSALFTRAGIAPARDAIGIPIEVQASPLSTPSDVVWRGGYRYAVDELPHTIDVDSVGEIEAAGASRLEDLTGYLPGVQPGSLNAGLSSALVMRGFAVTQMRWNGLPDIQRLFARDLYTVEADEVLPGPDGVLEGITSPGGSVNYHGKQPRFEAAQQVGLTMSERGGRRTVADSTAPLGDKLAYRVEHRAGETCGEPEG